MTDPVSVKNYQNKAYAEIAAGLLRNADIPYVIQSAEGMMHGPIFGGATILVAKENLERAKEILDTEE